MKSLPFLSASAIALVAMLVVGSSGARAEDMVNKDAYAQRLFVGKLGKEKPYACFVRKYDAAHLLKHPQQKVRAMKVLVAAEKVPEDEKLNYSFRLGVAFRDKPTTFDSSGSCGHPLASEVSADKLHIGCGVDCDGGGISIEMANHDKSIIVRLDRVRIWRNNNPEEESISLEAGADDGVFRLDRVNLDDCRSLLGEGEKLAALSRK